MKSMKNIGKKFLLSLIAALFVMTGCDQGLGVLSEPMLSGTVTIDGTPQVDEILTAQTTLDVPAGIENSYQYQWQKRAADDDRWISIDKAVNAGYTLVPDDQGNYIQVLVSVPGYRGSIAPETPAGLVAAGGPVSTPTAQPPASELDSGTTVTLSTTTEGATIHYTTDDSTPTSGSMQYSSPIPITVATTIKAIAVKAGREDSGILTAAYTVVAPGKVAQPSAIPAAGAVTYGATVTLSTNTEDPKRVV